MNRLPERTLAVLAVCLTVATRLAAQGSGYTMKNGDFMAAISVAPDLDLKRIPELKHCDARHQLIGYITGDGIITYVITADGMADTSTIKVASHQGVSAGTLASVATRVLPTCTFRAAETTRGKAPALVSQRLTFHSAEEPTFGQAPKVVHSTLVFLPGSDLALREFESTTDSLPSPAPDSTGIDEVPASLGCSFVHFSRQGDVVVSFVIGADGLIDLPSLRIADSIPPTAELTEAVRKVLKSCRFIPARRDGIPVPLGVTATVYSTDSH